jgi:hypothetical protein
VGIDTGVAADTIVLGRVAEDVVATESALPLAPTQGKNAEVGIHVYKGILEGKDVYVGTTNNMARRAVQHGGRFAIESITSPTVSRGEARAIEQAVISRRSPGLLNKRNSISPRHAWQQHAVIWGEHWLQARGL